RQDTLDQAVENREDPTGPTSTPTMFSTSLLLLLAAASCVHCEELTQPGSMVVRPDQSLTIDCKVSYSVTSHHTAWIRHPAGKAMEYIGVSEGQFGEDLQLSANSDQLQLHKHHAPHVCTAAADGRMCPLSDLESPTPSSFYITQSERKLQQRQLQRSNINRSSFHHAACSTDTDASGSSTLFSKFLCSNSGVLTGLHSAELNQPDFLTLRPDQTLTIDCKVSYSVTTYATAWVRQHAGKAPEWIGLVYAGGDIPYKDSLRSKFTISRDTSSNTVTLRGQNLQPEDTAVYYCARASQ
ncbi:hypothetical protein NFI96_013422, partial [Prochilodus magdalenae]